MLEQSLEYVVHSRSLSPSVIDTRMGNGKQESEYEKQGHGEQMWLLKGTVSLGCGEFRWDVNRAVFRESQKDASSTRIGQTTRETDSSLGLSTSGSEENCASPDDACWHTHTVR